MKKLSLDTLQSFDQDIISILSKKRLESYGGDIQMHYKNLELALEIGKRIANLEIYLRNKLDFCLKELVGEEWIKNEKSLNLISQKGHTPLNELNHCQILSSLMLGEIVGLIKEYRIESCMFDLRDIDFKKYHWSNKNYLYVKNRKTPFSNLSKNLIVLNLIRNIRNRAFHWENLLKVRNIDNTPYPRITHKENGANIGVMPDKILEFLDDLIEKIGNKVMKSYLK